MLGILPSGKLKMGDIPTTLWDFLQLSILVYPRVSVSWTGLEGQGIPGQMFQVPGCSVGS